MYVIAAVGGGSGVTGTVGNSSSGALPMAGVATNNTWGAVNGGDIYGTISQLTLDSDDDMGDGRLIPTTAVDQYAATLARWYGLGETQLNEVLPNLQNFTGADLGFMA